MLGEFERTSEPLHARAHESERAARISVVIPAYNASSHLRETIESALAQTLRPVEVIVVDDGSSDDTVAVARASGATVISRANGGISAARNTGIAAARGDFIALLDADDLWTRDKLETQARALEDHAGPAFSFTDFRLFDSRGVHAARSALRAHPAFRRSVGRARDGETVRIAANGGYPILPDMYFLPSSVLVRRSDILAVGGFDETMRGCEDVEFFLRLLRLAPALAVMRPLLLYRRHESQATAFPMRMIASEFALLDRIASDPRRYPDADVRYYLQKGSLINYRLGVCQARLGAFDEAIPYLRESLAERRTVRASLVLAAARAARGPVGRAAFETLRALRRRTRTERRSASPTVVPAVETA